MLAHRLRNLEVVVRVDTHQIGAFVGFLPVITHCVVQERDLAGRGEPLEWEPRDGYYLGLAAPECRGDSLGLGDYGAAVAEPAPPGGIETGRVVTLETRIAAGRFDTRVHLAGVFDGPITQVPIQAGEVSGLGSQIGIQRHRGTT
jgi:hypothetical protein